MSLEVAFSIVLGTALGLGLWAVVSAMPRWGSASLAQRVAPFVADFSPEAFRLSTRAPGNLGSMVGATWALLVRRLASVTDSVLGNPVETQRRLVQAGGSVTVEAFRARQVVWAVVAGAVGLLADVLLGTLTQATLAALITLPVAFLVTGYFSAEFALRVSVTRRTTRIGSELPTVFEFTSLCLAAGESITDSLRRVALLGSGEFARELAHVSRQVDTGVPLALALSQLSDRLQMPPVTRGVEQILGALDRGSPLAAVLQAQAQDAREDSKRGLLEKAGQKEVIMLIPLVFLILPVTILFAVFPGLLVVQAGFSF